MIIFQIIRDIQLMGLVALLLLVDILVLGTWGLADPIKCTHSVGAVVKVLSRKSSLHNERPYTQIQKVGWILFELKNHIVVVCY